MDIMRVLVRMQDIPRLNPHRRALEMQTGRMRDLKQTRTESFVQEDWEECDGLAAVTLM